MCDSDKDRETRGDKKLKRNTDVCRIFEYDCAFACVSSVFQDELKSKF